MIAVDTNVVVRLIAGDDPAQVDQALALARDAVLYISSTVLIETEWVLRSRYGFNRARTVEALRALSQLVAIQHERADDTEWAIDRFAVAGELADYMHIAAARDVGRFASFEKRLAHRVGKAVPAEIVVLGE